MTDETAETDDSPTGDRSLAARVDAIERALTDESVTTDAEAVLPPTTSVVPDRVEALEADFADLRASVEALRAVVADGRLRQDVATSPPATTISDGTAPTGSGDAADSALGALHAPTGREIPSPDEVSEGGSDGTNVSTDADDARSGLVARVADAF